MDDIVRVKVLKTEQNAADEKFNHIFGESFASSKLKPEISSRHIVHNQIEIESILKSIDHIDDKWMLELRQQLSFIKN